MVGQKDLSPKRFPNPAHRFSRVPASPARAGSEPELSAC
jgi:hypothetical protein